MGFIDGLVAANIFRTWFEYAGIPPLPEQTGGVPGRSWRYKMMVSVKTTKRRLLKLGRVSTRTQAIWVGTLDEFTGSLLRYP